MSSGCIGSHLPLQYSYQSKVLHYLIRCSLRALLLKDQQQQQHLDTCYKRRVSGCTPDLLSHLNKLPRWPVFPSILFWEAPSQSAVTLSQVCENVPCFQWWFLDTQRQENIPAGFTKQCSEESEHSTAWRTESKIRKLEISLRSNLWAFYLRICVGPKRGLFWEGRNRVDEIFCWMKILKCHRSIVNTLFINTVQSGEEMES